MGKIADKIPSDGLKTTNARQVLSQEEASARVLVGDYHELQILVACGHLNRLALHLACLLAPPPGLYELVIADNFDDAVVEWIAKLKKPPRRRIGKLDQPGCIRDQNAIRNLVQDRG